MNRTETDLTSNYKFPPCKVLSMVCYLAVTTLLLLSNFAYASDNTPRIVDGSIVEPGKYPFMVSVYFQSDIDGRFYPGCGGSHLGNGWVLTAAHCLVNPMTGELLNADTISVLLGTNDLTDQDAFFTGASRLIIHPEYDNVLITDDIALIQMEVNYDGPVISLPSSGSRLPAIGEDATVAGWGDTEEDGSGSLLLREVTLPVIPHAGCLPFFPEMFDRNKNFCAGGGANDNKDSCQGDSGGPMFVARDEIWVQAGVVSNGIGCGRSGFPALYSLVSTYTDWILANAETTLTWQDTGSNNVADAEIPALSSDNVVTERVLLGATDVFEVTGANRIEVVTLSGDADLSIYAGSDFRTATFQCVSQEFTVDSALDACDISADTQSYYAAVFGFEESEYEIRIISSAVPVVPVPVDPVQVDPAPVDAGPTNGEPENGESVGADPADDQPVTIATNPEDNSASLASSSSGGGGGTTGPLWIVMFAVAFRRRLFRR